MFALIAVILFLLAAFGVKFDEIDITLLGLASLALHMLVGAWPFGSVITFNRRAE
jgi:hypothetical protein